MSHSCPIHILLCTDSRYAHHCGVTATSALENAGGLPVEIHIFTDSLTAEDTLRFKSLERKYDCHINIKVISGQCVDRLPKNIKRWPPSSFMRLLAAELLPADIHRVIYLDCDTAVDTPSNRYGRRNSAETCVQWCPTDPTTSPTSSTKPHLTSVQHISIQESWCWTLTCCAKTAYSPKL